MVESHFDRDLKSQGKRKSNVMTGEQREILTLMASGYSTREIEEKTGYKAKAQMHKYRNGHSTIVDKLGAENVVEAVLKGLVVNEIDLERVVEERGISIQEFTRKYTLFSPAEKALMHAMTFNLGRTSMNIGLAETLGLSTQTVANHIGTILNKTGFIGRAQIAVLGMIIRNVRAVQQSEKSKPSTTSHSSDFLSGRGEVSSTSETYIEEEDRKSGEISVWEISRRKRESRGRFATDRQKDQRKTANKDMRYTNEYE